jgi:hypothetical protein
MTDQQPILNAVEAFLAETGMTKTRFGKDAVGDPRFVPGLRDGRRLWPETEAKVRKFIREHSRETAQ